MVVGIATRYDLEGSELEPRWGTFSGSDKTGPETRPAFSAKGTGSLSRG